MNEACESGGAAPAVRVTDARAGADAGVLHVLCAGAAQGLLTRLAEQLRERCGAEVTARFSAVGALRDALLAGEACDVLIVTDAMVQELGAAGHLEMGTRVVLGQVGTGIAVRRDETLPDVRDAAALAQILRAAQAIHFPDPLRSTAGVHFTGVLRRLHLLDTLADRLRTYPNGASAMRALAESAGPGHLGCTQISEIKFNVGVQLVASLPRDLELSTTYTAVVATKAVQPVAGRALVSLLGEPSLASVRAACGIEPASAN